MPRLRFRAPAAAVLLALSAIGLPAAQLPASALDAALAEFWAADGQREVTRAIERVIATGAAFDEVLARVVRGPAYAGTVPTGEHTWQARGPGGIGMPTTIVVPRDYRPDVKYPVRVYLHGGVMRDAPAENETRRPRRRLEYDAPGIDVYPTGFVEAPWWSYTQVENLDRVLTRLARTYNVDENRVTIAGVSDGGTGAYFFGLREATRWSAIFPFNGHLRVLANPEVGADGELFVSNLVNVPLYVVNGGQDRLYPVAAVQPFMDMLSRAGASVVFRPQPQAGHDTSWWPTERPAVERFEREHPRNPLPDRVSWQTERTDRYNRFRWIVIDALDDARESSAMADIDTLETTMPYDFGMRVDSRREEGRRVVDVIANSDAAKMGLRKGDLLTSMDGQPIRRADDIGRVFQAHLQRGPLRFVVERKGQAVEMAIEFPPAQLPAAREVAFPHRKNGGRVDAARAANTVEVHTRGVATFSLLLSPACIDFDRPIRVVVNGRTVHDQRIAPAVAVLLRWAARDRDRSMPIGAELRIDVPRTAS